MNYLYAILEGETRIALLTVGLDPGLGFLHTDQPARESLALDLMEAVRPEVDRWLYRWLQTVSFAKKDFVETGDGMVRVLRPVTVQLTATAQQWAAAAGPVVERVAKRLGGSKVRIATPLTEANRSAGRDGIRAVVQTSGEVDWSKESTRKPTSRKRTSSVPNACRECGTILEDGRRRFCSHGCRNDHHNATSVPKFVAAGPAALAERRAQGDDPAHGGAAGRKRGQRNAERARERAEWEAAHGDGLVERERFVREILPKLADIPLSRIVVATGFSLRYASLIRRGEYIPHPVHYEAFDCVVDEEGE